MRDASRLDKFYDDLKFYHKKYLPDIRFGQLIYIIDAFIKKKGYDTFYAEDAIMLEFIREFFEEKK